MPVKSEENIVEFQVTIDDSILVKVFEREAHLGGVKLRALEPKLTTLDVQHEITTGNILHDKVDASLGLEAGMQVKEEGVTFLVGNEEDALLRLSRLNFVVFDDELFLQYFDGVELFGVLGFSKHDLTKVTLSEHGKEVEMVEPNTWAWAATSRQSLLVLASDLLGWRLLDR